MKTIRLLIVLAVLAPSTMQAKEKPGITVRFRITEQKYVTKYGVMLPMIEKRLSTSAAKFLNNKIAVFKFSASSSFRDTLDIELGRRMPARSALSFDVLLTLKLTGENVKEVCTPAIWEFAPDGTYTNYRGDSALFVSKVLQRFKSDELFDKDELICKLLMNRWITENAEAIKIDFEHKFWILGFTYDQLEVGDESQFRIIQNHKQSQNQIIQRKFLASVKQLVTKNQDQQIYAEFIPADQLYKQKEGCCEHSFDDPAKFQKATLQNVCAFQIIKLTRFDKNSEVVSTSNAGIQR